MLIMVRDRCIQLSRVVQCPRILFFFILQYLSKAIVFTSFDDASRQDKHTKELVVPDLGANNDPRAAIPSVQICERFALHCHWLHLSLRQGSVCQVLEAPAGVGKKIASRHARVRCGRQVVKESCCASKSYSVVVNNEPFLQKGNEFFWLTSRGGFSSSPS